MTRNGKTFNEYMHQAAPGAPVEHFSDRPITVGGVRYFPKWPWSDGYRKHFRTDHTNPPPNGNGQDGAYRKWLYHDRDISFEGATELIRKQRRSMSF